MTERNTRLSLVVLINAIILLFLAVGCINDISSGDSYFLIATGRHIINNGIPYTNPWGIVDNMPFVAQQWLYCIWIYIVNLLGPIGWWLSIVLIGSGLYACMYKLARNRGISIEFSLSAATLSLVAGNDYMINLRPEAITVLFLLAQCLFIEQYQKSGKLIWLYLMPILTLLEINLHASMWILHICVLIPYLMPYPKAFCRQDTPTLAFRRFELPIKLCTPQLSFKRVLLPIALMLGSLFVNPYGLDAIFYVFRALGDSRMSMLNIVELKFVTIASEFGFAILAAVVCLFSQCVTSSISSVSLYMSAGLLVLSIRELRSVMFLPIVFIFLLRDLFSTETFRNLDNKLQSRSKAGYDIVQRNICKIVCCILCLDTVVMLTISAKDTANDQQRCSDYVSFVDTILEQSGEHAVVYTGFNAGAYLEYRGLDNVFMDARPELFFYSVDDSLDIIDDELLAIWGIVPSGDNTWVNASEDDYQAMIDRYDFEYFIVGKQTEPNLYGYLSRHSEYSMLDDNTNAALFKTEVK